MDVFTMHDITGMQVLLESEEVPIRAPAKAESQGMKFPELQCPQGDAPEASREEVMRETMNPLHT
ncbi:MAG: hypothetical protein M3Z24_13600, partial [Chloroflexota bacterium]|nr:hypothetical protein [Chloroflexota bacterium]